MGAWKRFLSNLGRTAIQQTVEQSPATDIIEAVTGTAGKAGIDTFVITFPTKDKVAITVMLSRNDFDNALKGRVGVKP